MLFSQNIADDGYLCGPVEDVLRALTVFGDQVEAECGLRLNRRKT